MFTRRHALKTSAIGSLGLGSSLIGKNSFAKTASDDNTAKPDPHFFVYVQMVGAWDTCLAFDPKNRDSLLKNGSKAFDQPYDINEVNTYGQIPLAPAGQVLAPFADKMAVINGIDMELDNGHDPVMVVTGLPSGNDKPSIQAYVSAYNPHVKSTNIPHLYTALDGFFHGGSLTGGTIVVDPLGAYRILAAKGGADEMKRAALATRASAVRMTPSSKRDILRFADAQMGASELKSRLESLEFPEPNTTESFANFCASLFKNGISGSISWSFSHLAFDTHSSHFETHPIGLALTDVAMFINTLKNFPLDSNLSVWDRTTMVICSEFSRTPRLNSSNGKDHNFRSNSLVLLGHKVKPGVFGQSGEVSLEGGAIEAHAALPIDFLTGSANLSGELMRVRNLWAGSSSLFGFKMQDKFGPNVNPVGFI